MTLKALIPVPALVMMAGVLMLPAPAAHAAPMTFTAILSAANEVQTPPVVSPATGLATIVLDPTAHTLQISATFSGLLSNTVAAHIHCCAPVGANAGVATTVPTFPYRTDGSDLRHLRSHVLQSHAGFDLQSGLCHATGWARAGRGDADRGNHRRTDLL